MDGVSVINMLTPSYEALLVGAATAVTTSAFIEGLGTELDKDGNYYTTPDTHTRQKVEWKKAVQLKRKIESYCADD